MVFDQYWEHAHATRGWGKYPNEQFVRFMLGNFKNVPDRRAVKVLEIGSGGGANLWFVAKEGFSAYGFDASPSAIKNSNEFLKSEKLDAQLAVEDADNIDKLFPGVEFDVILDICTLSHMKYSESSAVVDKAIKRLKPEGKFFSITFAKGTWGDGLGEEIAPDCFSNIGEGPLKGIGVVQLMSLENIQQLAAKFGSCNIEEISWTMNERKNQVKYFLLTAQK